MGTKRNPGKRDCYAKAGEDEPLFILRAADPAAPATIRKWVNLTLHQRGSKARLDQLQEALAQADAMEEWRRDKETEEIEVYPPGCDNYGSLPSK